MVELREDRPARHPISKKRVQNATFRSRARLGVDGSNSHSARCDRPRPGRNECTHTSPSEDKEEEEDGFDLVVEGEIDDERVYRALVCRNATLQRGSGTIRTCQRKQSTRGEKRYPDGPDGHDALHITLALGHRPDAGLTTTACGGSGDLEDLVCVVDVEEQVGETEDWDYGAHVAGLTTVVSPMKVALYACRNRAEKAEKGECEGGGRWKKREEDGG